jgi:hypothetical protein
VEDLFVVIINGRPLLTTRYANENAPLFLLVGVRVSQQLEQILDDFVILFELILNSFGGGVKIMSRDMFNLAAFHSSRRLSFVLSFGSFLFASLCLFKQKTPRERERENRRKLKSD